jgi:hypothetical protein
VFDPFADRLDAAPPASEPRVAAPTLRSELLAALTPPALEAEADTAVSSEAPWDRSDSPSTAR